MRRIEKLMAKAVGLGASAAALVLTKDIVVEKGLADRCREPRCHNFGLSKSCPPNVSGPLAFRKELDNFSQAIFFKLDVPSKSLYSSDRRKWFQLLHETAAGIEQHAMKMGFTAAKAFAGGSCKGIFCFDHPDCQALSKKGECRNPLYARPSMSGFGINVGKLVESAGWTETLAYQGSDDLVQETSGIYGLVLIS